MFQPQCPRSSSLRADFQSACLCHGKVVAQGEPQRPWRASSPFAASSLSPPFFRVGPSCAACCRGVRSGRHMAGSAFRVDSSMHIHVPTTSILLFTFSKITRSRVCLCIPLSALPPVIFKAFQNCKHQRTSPSNTSAFIFINHCSVLLIVFLGKMYVEEKVHIFIGLFDKF